MHLFTTVQASVRKLISGSSPTQLRQRTLYLEQLESRDLLSVDPILLDLGNACSPKESEYQRVSLHKYSEDTGTGWLDTEGMNARDDRGADALMRDFHEGRGIKGTDQMFLVDLPNGTYDLTLLMGTENEAMDQIDLWLEGEKVQSNLSIPRGEQVRRSWQIGVDDGQLNLRIVDQGGSSRFFALNGLEIRPVAPDPVTISIGDVTISEGDSGTTSAVFTVSLSEATNNTVTVEYATVDGSATTADNDYQSVTGTLSLAPGETSRAFSVPVIGDTVEESENTFYVRLSGAVNATLSEDQGTGTITNDDGSANTIFIDQAWLDARGDGAYLLDQAGMTYVLKTDVRTEGTAFVVAASDVVFDLDGHSITYGDRAPTRVLNGGFETGTGTEIPGWDLVGAPAATLASNTNYLYGNQVLRLSSFSTRQTIVSDPVAIPVANHSYTATITPANVHTQSTVTLSVIDSITGEVLGSGTSHSANRGFTAVAHFTPTTLNPVRLQIDVTPPLGGTDTIDLDQATLTVSHDYGILASDVWSGGLPGYGNLTPEAQATYQQSGNFIIKNGSIVQGQGDGYASSPLYFLSLDGFTIDNVETFATGTDTVSLEASRASVRARVVDSIFQEDIDTVSNRIRTLSTLRFDNVSTDIVIENNQLLGSPQVGVLIDRNDPLHSISVRDNVFSQNGVVSNAYAILLSAVQNFVISGNNIVTTSGRGVMLDGYRSAPTAHGEIMNNTVDVQEAPNREYPRGLDAIALRLRNSVDGQGAHQDLYLHDNTFIARTTDGLVKEAYGARLSYVNNNGAMDNAGIVLENNTFKAIVTSRDTSLRAKAFLLDLIDPGINLRIAGNVFESNDVSLALDDTSGSVHDVELISNVFRKSDEGSSRPYTGILAGYWIHDVQDVRIIGAQLENGATLNIDWRGTGIRDLSIGWLLDVVVKSPSWNPVSGATVEVRNNTGSVVSTGFTDLAGRLNDISFIVTVYQRLTTGSPGITEHHFGPGELTVFLDGVVVAEMFNLMDNLELFLIL